MRVLQASHDLDFVQEPLGTECGGQLRMQDLDRDLAMMAQVLVWNLGRWFMRISGWVTPVGSSQQQ